MRKLDFESIRKANHVLFFLCACVGLVILCVMLVFIVTDVLFSSSSRDETAVVVKTGVADGEVSGVAGDENNAENEGGVKEEEEKEYIEFNRMLKDVYVFDVLDSSLCVKKDVKIHVKYRSSRSTEVVFDGVLANFLFLNDKKEERKLFPSNLQYIIKHSFVDTCNCGIYAVIKNDSNGDKEFDYSDDVSLYASDCEGNNLMELSSSVIYSRSIGHGKILFSEFCDGEERFYVFDCVKKEKELIKSVKQEKRKHRYNDLSF